MTDKRAGAAGQKAAGLESELAVGRGKEVGNRPANNAHLATPAAAAAHAQTWHAQNGASDFLGLDQELSGQAAQAAMIAPPPLATAQAVAPRAIADESWLMEMTDNPSRPAAAAARAPKEAPLPVEETPLLNASWREPEKPARRRSLVAPLVACGVIGALALVGWPMLHRQSPATENDAGADLAKASAPAHAWDRKDTAPAAPQDAAEPDHTAVASVAPTREEAPTLPDSTLPESTVNSESEPIVKPTPPPANSGREVADARTEVGATNESPSSVEGLVEVVPLARVNTPTSKPSTTSSHADVTWGVPADDENGLDQRSSADDVVSADDTSELPEFVNPLAEPYQPPKTSVVTAPPQPVKPAPEVVVAAPQPTKPAPEVVIVAPPAPKKPAPEVVVVTPPAPVKPAPEVVVVTPPAPVKPAPEVVAAAKPTPAPVVSERTPPSTSTSSPAVVSAPKVEVAAPAHDPAPVAAKPAPQQPVASSVAVAGAPHDSAVAQPAPAVASFVGPALADVGQPPPFDQASMFGPVPDAKSDSQTIALNGATPNPSARKVQLAVDDVLLLSDGGTSLHQASDKELSGVWTQNSVPMESIGSPTKVLTPSVGKVRVTLSSGEVFEGGLYAVGEGSVWIDSQYGRMGLAGARVKSVEQIDVPKVVPGAPAVGADRVRIKTPGGVFVGRIVDRDGKKTTLLTDDGSRLTLDTKDVQVLDQAPAVAIKKK